jgi:DNA mismatch endonuclease, patch repair protein
MGTWLDRVDLAWPGRCRLARSPDRRLLSVRHGWQVPDITVIGSASTPRDAVSGSSLCAVADYPHPLNPGRSANMRANRRKDTKPELELRRALHARGYRYRKDYRLDLTGARVRPDIAFTARRVAVFVDGCFWHCCPEHGSQPANNTWYWQPKLARNVERDRAADTALAEAGWNVVRVWEHESVDAAVEVVIGVLADSTAGRSKKSRKLTGT